MNDLINCFLESDKMPENKQLIENNDLNELSNIFTIIQEKSLKIEYVGHCCLDEIDEKTNSIDVYELI